MAAGYYLNLQKGGISRIMKKIKTAIVGLGRIGWGFHLPEVRKHSDRFILAAVVDPLPERHVEVRKLCDAACFCDYADMLKKICPELVVVASPTHVHAEQVMAALEQGSDVFCDKPLAPDLAMADAMIEVARRTGRKLMVYQPHRATDIAVGARDIISRGILGPIYMIKAALSAYTRRNDWQAWRQYGGGMLNNYGAHLIDQLLYLADDKAMRLRCHLRTIASLGDADDVVKLVMETERGLILDLDINMATAYAFTPLMILGKHGTLRYDAETRTFMVKIHNPDLLAREQASMELAAKDRNYGNAEKLSWEELRIPAGNYATVDFYEKVYEYLALDAPPFVPLAETRELMRILDACRGNSAPTRN